MYTHQDWNVVTFRAKNTENGKEKRLIRQAQQQGNKVDTTARKVPSQGALVSIAKLDDNKEVFIHKTIPKEIADAIKNARVEQKLTQVALAQRINEKVNVVQDVESMKGVYNHMIINKLLRSLGLSLKSIRLTT
jgi:ribosome-binding protein aMBF1 (putative translation factor)